MDYYSLIYQTAISGSPVNPGLPDVLSRLVAAQAAHETGNFTSNFFKKYNNAFGYSYSGSRYQAGAGTVADNGQPIAAYGSIQDSVYELIDWLYRRQGEGKLVLNNIKSPEDYAAALKGAGYYGDSLANYLRGLKRFFLDKPVVSSTGILLVAVCLYFLTRSK